MTREKTKRNEYHIEVDNNTNALIDQVKDKLHLSNRSIITMAVHYYCPILLKQFADKGDGI